MTAPNAIGKNLTIAYLTNVYARSSDTFIRSEVLALRARGHTVHTFSVRRAEADQHVGQEVLSEQASTDYILLHSLVSLVLGFVAFALRRPGRMLRTLSLAWRIRPKGIKGAALQLIYVIEAAYLARRLMALRVQIMHNHIAENSASVAMFASLLSGVPYSMTVHGPGIFFHPKQWALGEKIARSAFTACITHFCKSQCMLFSDPEDWPKLEIVRCGVGASFVDVEPVPVPLAPRLVCVGRICAEKGMLLLVQAVAQYIAEGGDCELVMVGDGPLRGAIERLVEQRGLQGKVRILGWQSSESVRAELEQSRALVLPSFAEGLPVVVMEALALGRPVVTSAIAGIPELVLDGQNGWLVPPSSMEGLVAAIRAVAEATPERLDAMGRLGAASVARLHSIEREVGKLEQLFARHGLA
jgi:colanic acid/amylovoran biosynthesis glycosyltransferase